MKALLKTLYAMLIVLGLWWLAASWLDSFTLPSPVATFTVLVQEFSEKILPHLLASYQRLLWAVGISAIIGGSLGIALGSSDTLSHYISPIVHLFYPIPRVAFLPLFLVWLGLGEVAKISLMVAVAIFYFILPVEHTVRNLPQSYHFIARTLGFTRSQWFLYVVLPAALKDLFQALRLTIGATMAALFTAENIASTSGLGYYIMNAWSFSNYPSMYAGIVCLCVSGGLLYLAIEWCEKWLVKT